MSKTTQRRERRLAEDLRQDTAMRRCAIVTLLLIMMLTSGCATNTQRCSGRISKDNGHITRNEEDCVWGEQYAPVRFQPTYAVSAPVYAPQVIYVPAPVPVPPQVYYQPIQAYQAPVINFSFGATWRNQSGRYRRR